MTTDLKMHHVGLWVQPEDCNAVQVFFAEMLGFWLVSRVERTGGGHRMLLKNSAAQYIEILTSDDVTKLDYYPRHPKDRVAGVPHLCFAVANLDEVKAKAIKLGAEIIVQAPADGSFSTSELGEHRLLNVQAPGGVTVEMFEFKQQLSP